MTLAASATRWLTPPEVARKLGIDAQKVLRWIRRGELRAVNVALGTTGKCRWRIAPDALSEFLARRECRPPTATPRRRQEPAKVIEFF